MRNIIYQTLVIVVLVLYFATGLVQAENACYPVVTELGVVYNDAIQPHWNMRLTSINGVTEDTEAVTTGKIGAHAIKVDYHDLWKEYTLSRAVNKPWHTAGTKALVFRVKGIQNKGYGQVMVHVRSPSLATLCTVPITDHMIDPPDGWNYDPNTWYTVTIPLSALNAENVYVQEIGFAGSDYTNGGVGTIYLDEIWWVEELEFPLAGYTAGTAPISSVFDHTDSNSMYNCRDEWIVAFTGEVGHSNNGESPFWSRTVLVNEAPAECVGDVLRGYAQDLSQTPFSINGQYDLTETDNENGVYLFYDGHSGYDYPATDGTAFYSIADGTVESASVGEIVVDHYNGYKSYYLHNSTVNIGAGKKVEAGVTKLGETGDDHLHLTLKLHGVRVDPYGWDGNFEDPSRPFAVNIPLWK